MDDSRISASARSWISTRRSATSRPARTARLKTLSLVGADLALTVDKREIGATLEALKLPVIATGPMRIDTRIKDVGKHRQLELKAKLGDLDASVKGTLKTRSLIGSDLTFEASAADAARLAAVFEVRGVPAAPLTVTGHTLRSRKELKFDALTVAIADASVRSDGSAAVNGRPHSHDEFRYQGRQPGEAAGHVACAGGRGQRCARVRERPPGTEGSASHAGQDPIGRFVARDRGQEKVRGAAVVAAHRPHAILSARQAG